MKNSKPQRKPYEAAQNKGAGAEQYPKCFFENPFVFKTDSNGIYYVKLDKEKIEQGSLKLQKLEIQFGSSQNYNIQAIVKFSTTKDQFIFLNDSELYLWKTGPDNPIKLNIPNVSQIKKDPILENRFFIVTKGGGLETLYFHSTEKDPEFIRFKIKEKIFNIFPLIDKLVIVPRSNAEHRMMTFQSRSDIDNKEVTLEFNLGNKYFMTSNLLYVQNDKKLTIYDIRGLKEPSMLESFREDANIISNDFNSCNCVYNYMNDYYICGTKLDSPKGSFLKICNQGNLICYFIKGQNTVEIRQNNAINESKFYLNLKKYSEKINQIEEKLKRAKEQISDLEACSNEKLPKFSYPFPNALQHSGFALLEACSNGRLKEAIENKELPEALMLQMAISLIETASQSLSVSAVHAARIFTALDQSSPLVKLVMKNQYPYLHETIEYKLSTASGTYKDALKLASKTIEALK